MALSVNRMKEKMSQFAFKDGPQQVEFRNDCNDSKWVWTEVAEIYPGQRA